MKRLRGFTLAEVLITLAIIGVVAAISIPSVISNSQQQEFKTGLRKAVSVLNSAITMNIAIDGESPYDNANLAAYLMKHMSVLKSVTRTEYEYKSYTVRNNGQTDENQNFAFYTTDGMRFEFAYHESGWNDAPLHESRTIKACNGPMGSYNASNTYSCGGCGSYGLNNNTDGTTKPPCLMLVDVNGDRKPTPMNVNCKNSECARVNLYKVPAPSEKNVRDTFSLLVTDKKVIPYGVTAQKAMYNAQK